MCEEEFINAVDSIAQYQIVPTDYNLPSLGVQMIDHVAVPVYRRRDIKALWKANGFKGHARYV